MFSTCINIRPVLNQHTVSQYALVLSNRSHRSTLTHADLTVAFLRLTDSTRGLQTVLSRRNYSGISWPAARVARFENSLEAKGEMVVSGSIENERQAHVGMCPASPIPQTERQYRTVIGSAIP
jgi:hypothetical protein